MYKNILVPIDVAEAQLARPAIAAARMMIQQSGGTIRLIHVLPLSPVMLAEYVPPDFEVQQRKTAEESLAAHLYRPEIPDPDLLIRTAGEMRLSNFLLWETAYAEIWVTPTLWPDFSRAELLRAILDYQKRDRRYGGLGKPTPVPVRDALIEAVSVPTR